MYPSTVIREIRRNSNASREYVWLNAQRKSGVLRKEGIHIVRQTIYNHVHADSTGKLRPHMPHELKYTRRYKAYAPPKPPILPTEAAYINVPQRQTGRVSEIGKWTPWWIHTDMQF